MFYSAYKKEELDKLTKDDILYIIGIYENGEWIKLPRCKKCGGLLLEDSLYGLCDDCGMFFKLYISKDMKEWCDDENSL